MTEKSSQMDGWNDTQVVLLLYGLFLHVLCVYVFVLELRPEADVCPE